MIRPILAVALLATSSSAFADGAHGVWRTESNDSGGYLEVTIGPCESDPGLTCGIISNAFGKDGADPGYENLGKLMIHDMKLQGADSYAGGTIWDPEKDKTYKSKMSVKGDDLDVEGCISFVCIGEDWKKVR